MELRTWWKFVNALWKFIRRHNAPETDEDWRAVFDDAGRMNDEYDDQKVFRKIIFDVIERWEDEAHEAHEAEAMGADD